MAAPGWRLRDLAAGTALLTALVGVAALPVTALASCAVHEIGHGLVGTALGYQVELITFCPGAASVRWAPSALPPVDQTIEAWAGGLVAATVLVGLYGAMALRRLPARYPAAWAAAISIAGVAGVQAVIGILEGASSGRYVELIDRQPLLYLPLIGGGMLAGVAAHLVLWREVLAPPNRNPPLPQRDASA